MKRILFRADANPSIGTGDLISLIHLSRYFERKDWETHFFIRNYNLSVHLVKAYKIKNVAIIEQDATLEREITEINKYLKDKKINAVFLEITERNLKEYIGLSKDVFKACVSFDGRIPFDMDLVVNWDVAVDRAFNILNYPRTTFLLGPEYVILPMEFDFKKINKRIQQGKPETLLVTMGGIDEFNITMRLIEILIKNKIDLKLNIILGVGYRPRSELEEMLAASRLSFKIKQNATSMFGEYMKSDMAIAAGGLTAFELIATRTPTVLIAVYRHQISRCKYFDKKGVAKYLGFQDFNERLLIKSIRSPLKITYDGIFNTDTIRERVDGLCKRR